MRRTPATRVDENNMHEEIPTQVEKVEQVSQNRKEVKGALGYQVPIVE